MIDINLLRTNPDLVRENIRKKFQDAKLPLVDEVLDFDKRTARPSSGRTICVPSATRSASRSAC